MAQAGDAAHFHPGGLLGLQDGAGAEGVAALQRKRMVEDVEHAGHGARR